MLKKAAAQCAAMVVASVVLAGCGGGAANEGGGPAEVPYIVVGPSDAVVLTGSRATFVVSASGTNPTFQWKRNGVEIPGANGRVYTTDPVTYQDQGASYSVTISNSLGVVVSNAAKLTLALSTDQYIYETFAVAPSAGAYLLHWNLNYSGAQTTLTNYFESDYFVTALSPLTNGPQVTQQQPLRNLASTLALLTISPTRVLKNGTILAVPQQDGYTVQSYVGPYIQIDNLAQDNTTVAYSRLRGNYTSVNVSGLTMANAPDELKHAYNSIFSNTAVLNQSSTFQSGSAYMTYAEIAVGDRYNVFDCQGSTTGTSPVPCATSATIEALLSPGFASASDGTTYTLTDGTIVTGEGLRVWVAKNPRPTSSTLSTTLRYRTYFELGGNVYTGDLIKDGTLYGGGYWVSNPNGATVDERLTYLQYQIRLNKAAHDSIAAASRI